MKESREREPVKVTLSQSPRKDLKSMLPENTTAAKTLTHWQVSALEAARVFPGLQAPKQTRNGCKFQNFLRIQIKRSGEVIRAAIATDQPLSFQETRSAVALLTGLSPWACQVLSADCECFDF